MNIDRVVEDRLIQDGLADITKDLSTIRTALIYCDQIMSDTARKVIGRRVVDAHETANALWKLLEERRPK